MVKSTLEDTKKARDQVMDIIEGFGWEEAKKEDIKLAFTEAIANAYKHGNKRQPEKKIAIDYTITPHIITLAVRDSGHGFDMGKVRGIDMEGEDGRGLFLIKQLCSSVRWEEGGKCVIMTWVN